MGIGIYTAADPSTGLSIDGVFTNPLVVPMDGRLGAIYQKKLYIRNNDNTLYYTTITLKSSNQIDTWVIDGSKGITWKLSAGNTQPYDDQWLAIATANTISLSDIGSIHVGDTTTYIPFWLRVQVPRNIEVQTLLTTTLDISASENLVT